jgi:hypothetical protein
MPLSHLETAAIAVTPVVDEKVHDFDGEVLKFLSRS